MSLALPKGWPSLLIAIVSSFLLLSVLIIVHAHTVRLAMEGHGHNLITILDELGDDVAEALSQLNEQGLESCSDENLLLMRRIQFQYPVIRDIGFHANNHLVCTTGLGMLKTPLPSAEPDYVGKTGFYVYTNRKLVLFEREVSAFIIGHQHYSLVLDIGVLSKVDILPFVWEAVHLYQGKITHFAGLQGTYTRATRTKTNVTPLPNPQFFDCSKTFTSYCIAVSADALKLIHAQLWHYCVIFMLSMLTGVLVYSGQERLRRHRRSVKHRVKKGLGKGNFYWLVQPILSLSSDCISGCEILARFEDKYGPIFPDQFIPILRELDLNWTFTEVMLKTVLTEMEQRQEFPDGFRLGFNLFPRDFKNNHSIDRLITMPAVISSRFKIVLEIVEDESLDSSEVQANIRRLTDNGFTIAIDDFGTGYSNLNALKNIDCQILKIDRSFVMDMEDKSVRSSLIPHIIEIANELKLDIVAEGVEYIAQKEQLAVLGVSHVQGYLFGRPMPIEELVVLLTGEPVQAVVRS